jgi:hypothetical protein
MSQGRYALCGGLKQNVAVSAQVQGGSDVCVIIVQYYVRVVACRLFMQAAMTMEDTPGQYLQKVKHTAMTSLFIFMRRQTDDCASSRLTEDRRCFGLQPHGFPLHRRRNQIETRSHRGHQGKRKHQVFQDLPLGS